MKNALTILILAAAFSAAASAQECSKNTDACVSTQSRRSPFLEASSRPEPAARPLPKAAPGKTLRPAASAPVAPAPAAPAAASTAAAVPLAAPKQETFSNPLWLLFAFGGLAALYFYLTSGKRGRRK